MGSNYEERRKAMSITLPFLNEKYYLCGDRPLHFKGVMTEPHMYASWVDVQHCLNNPWSYNIEILDENNKKMPLATVPEQWHKSWHIEKREIFDLVNNGHTFVIGKYGHHNRYIEDLLQNIENKFDVNCDVHLYGGLSAFSKSFKIHWDQPANYIIQLYGETRWRVFNERCSTLINYTGFPHNPEEEDVTPALDVILEVGDLIYIPSRCYHCASPSDKRLSMSIPLWHDYEHRSDRNEYVLKTISNS